ncbi:MAG TPA: tetratricopeptide repeat protein [Gammaproteobacteria bacterium]|nr:tetratricopeptide repeat protein [Gammaproteobacteria bacterium]
MARWVICGLAVYCVASATSGQPAQLQDPSKPSADSRTVIGVGNEFLAAGAEAIRAQQYDDGIRLTKLGLARPGSTRDRAAGLSNLCAAYAAKGELDLAIRTCTEALQINDQNWHAYNNRSYAYYKKKQYRRANADLERAVAINPSARTMTTIRGMINESTLQPSVTVEEHQ